MPIFWHFKCQNWCLTFMKWTLAERFQSVLCHAYLLSPYSKAKATIFEKEVFFLRSLSLSLSLSLSTQMFSTILFYVCLNTPSFWQYLALIADLAS